VSIGLSHVISNILRRGEEAGSHLGRFVRGKKSGGREKVPAHVLEQHGGRLVEVPHEVLKEVN